MIEKSQTFVSVIACVDSDNVQFLPKIRSIQSILNQNYSDYEIVLIVQKRVQAAVSVILDPLLKELPCVRSLQLSGNVSPDVAWAAGLENGIGDFLILFSLGTDPVDVIVKAVELCKSGNDVVIGTSRDKHGLFYGMVRPFVSWLLKLSDYQLPKNSTTFRCMSRRSANAVMETGRFAQQFFLRIQKTGYDCTSVEYTEEVTTHKSLYQSFRELIKLLVFNSSSPLRLMSTLGLVGSFCAFVFALYSLVINLLKDNVVTGWTSTIFLISFFAFLQFVILAFISEYIARLLDEDSLQDYSIVSEKTSSVMVNQDRLNVMSESISDDQNLVQTARDK